MVITFNEGREMILSNVVGLGPSVVWWQGLKQEVTLKGAFTTLKQTSRQSYSSSWLPRIYSKSSDCSFLFFFFINSPNKWRYSLSFSFNMFAGDRQIACDLSYRQRVSINKSLDWSQVDVNLYNKTFAGKGWVFSRCKHCSSEHHTS